MMFACICALPRVARAFTSKAPSQYGRLPRTFDPTSTQLYLDHATESQGEEINIERRSMGRGRVSDWSCIRRSTNGASYPQDTYVCV